MWCTARVCASGADRARGCCSRCSSRWCRRKRRSPMDERFANLTPRDFVIGSIVAVFLIGLQGFIAEGDESVGSPTHDVTIAGESDHGQRVPQVLDAAGADPSACGAVETEEPIRAAGCSVSSLVDRERLQDRGVFPPLHPRPNYRPPTPLPSP